MVIDQETPAFRKAFGRIAEMRSYVPEIPVLALTATAMPIVKMSVIRSLELNNFKEFESFPDRENIQYVVRRINNAEFRPYFEKIRRQLNEQGISFPKVAIFIYSKGEGRKLVR